MEVKDPGSFRRRLALAGEAFNLLLEESTYPLLHLGGDVLVPQRSGHLDRLFVRVQKGDTVRAYA